MLSKDIHSDSCQDIINAIKMIKHILYVKGEVANPDIYMAENTAPHELRMKPWEAFNPSTK